MRGALTRYRIMAFVVGTALVILVFVAIPLQYWAQHKAVAEIVAPIHGYLYIVYLVAAADLARRAHWRLGRILMVVAAGFVPFLAFIVEHHVNGQMQAEFAAEAASASSADLSSVVGDRRAPRRGRHRRMTSPRSITERHAGGRPDARRSPPRRRMW